MLLALSRSAQSVLRYLHAFVRKANIESAAASAAIVDRDEQRPETHTQFRILGQYAIVGLLRVNTLLADYTSALNVCEGITLPSVSKGKVSSIRPSQHAAQLHGYSSVRSPYDCARQHVVYGPAGITVAPQVSVSFTRPSPGGAAITMSCCVRYPTSKSVFGPCTVGVELAFTG